MLLEMSSQRGSDMKGRSLLVHRASQISARAAVGYWSTCLRLVLAGTRSPYAPSIATI